MPIQTILRINMLAYGNFWDCHSNENMECKYFHREPTESLDFSSPLFFLSQCPLRTYSRGSAQKCWLWEWALAHPCPCRPRVLPRVCPSVAARVTGSDRVPPRVCPSMAARVTGSDHSPVGAVDLLRTMSLWHIQGAIRLWVTGLENNNPCSSCFISSIPAPITAVERSEHLYFFFF